MGILDCYKLDVKAVLKNRKAWSEELLELQDELNDVVTTEAISYDSPTVTHSNISDSTARLAELREPIIDKIEALQRDIGIVDKAVSTLSEDEQAVIKVFSAKGYVSYNIQQFGIKYGYSERGVYRLYNTALQNIREAILEALRGAVVKI